MVEELGVDSFELVSSASAPGKVILFGDHAVVYGRSAVAASVSDLRVQVDVALTSTPHIVIHFIDLLREIDGNALKYSTTVSSMQLVLGSLSEVDSVNINGSMEGRAPSQDVVSMITSYPIEHGYCSGQSQQLTASESKAITSTIYLTACIALPFLTVTRTTSTSSPSSSSSSSSTTSDKGLYIRVTSKGLPVGAGLGSSAALSVATSAALLKLKVLLNEKASDYICPFGKVDDELNPSNSTHESSSSGDSVSDGGGGVSGDDNSGMIPSDKWLQCINEWAFAAEVVMTGTPSGIDNTVSCFGNAVRYRRGIQGLSPSIDYLKDFIGIKILLTDTKVPRETKVLVAKVKALKNQSQEMDKVIDAIFDGIENVTEAFLSYVELSKQQQTPKINQEKTALKEEEGGGKSVPVKDHESSRKENTIPDAMQQLVRINQELLNSIGVGHEALDKVCLLGRRYGFETKLTGAGGGGCAFTLIEPRVLEKARSEEESQQSSLVLALEAEGYRCYESRIAGNGVLWVKTPSHTELSSAAAADTVTSHDGNRSSAATGRNKTDLQTSNVASSMLKSLVVLAFFASSALVLNRCINKK